MVRPDSGLQFLAMVEAVQPLEAVAIGEPEQAAAIAILRRFADQDLTMVDATGLHPMLERRVENCWSTDRHLGLAGVPLVIHQL